MIEENNLATIPVGPLGIVSMKSCEELGKRVDAYISSWRNERENEHKHTIAFAGYQKDSYPDSVQVRQKVLLTNQSEVKIYIS